MPQDPFLYGRPKPKKQKKTAALPSSLGFAAQMSSMIASSSSTSSSTAKPKSSKLSYDLPISKSKPNNVFTSAKTKRKEEKEERLAAKEERLRLKSPTGTHEEELERERARKKMEEKVRVYNALKRGDRVIKDDGGERAPLVDFDSKWAQRHDPNHPDYNPSGSEEEDDDEYDEGIRNGRTGRNRNEEMVEWEDDLGRTRRTTLAEKLKHDRQMNRRMLGQEELDRISARPAAPSNLIYGDSIQHMAFVPSDEAAEKMAELAEKRDREPTPMEDEHYDANWEIRDKGVGFYQFSKDETTRMKEMEELERERRETERIRNEKEEATGDLGQVGSGFGGSDAESKRNASIWDNPKVQRRKREIEKRHAFIEEKRAQILGKRARRQADAFLEGLGLEMSARDGQQNEESG